MRGYTGPETGETTIFTRAMQKKEQTTDNFSFRDYFYTKHTRNSGFFPVNTGIPTIEITISKIKPDGKIERSFAEVPPVEGPGIVQAYRIAE